jgi:hypothetical protein
MLNRKAHWIIISVRIKADIRLRFTFPIPLILFIGLSEFLEDAAFFIPPMQEKDGDKMSPSAIRQIIQTSADLVRGFALRSEPIDFVDVDIKDGEERVMVKLLLK